MWSAEDEHGQAVEYPNPHTHNNDRDEEWEEAGHAQTETALMTLMREGKWQCVSEILQRDEEWEGAGHAQTETALMTLMREGKWQCVSEILQRDEEWEGAGHAQTETALVNLMRAGKWQCVSETLQRDEEWEEAGHAQTETALVNLMRAGKWQCVSEILQRGLPEPHRGMIVEEATKRLDYRQLGLYILPHCSDDQLESCLKTLVIGDQWRYVSEVLATFAFGKAVVGRAVEEASLRADGRQFTKYILPHYSEDMLDLVLTNFVKRGMWGSVREVLMRSNPRCQKTVEEAVDNSAVDDLDESLETNPSCMTSDLPDWEIDTHLLPYIPEHHLEHVLAVFVEQGAWQFVGNILSRNVSEAVRNWACEEATERLDDLASCEDILDSFSDDRLLRLLVRLVLTGQWQSVNTVLHRDVGKVASDWAVKESSERADDFQFCTDIFPFCSDEQLEVVLAVLVRRGMWQSISKLLEKPVSESRRMWVLEKASENLRPLEFKKYILPHILWKDSIKHFLTNLMKRGMGGLLGDLLADWSITEAIRSWIVEEASKTLDDFQFKFYILHHCVKHRGNMHAIVSNLLDRHMYESLSEVLLSWKAVGKPLCKWLVEEASRKLDDLQFSTSIINNCAARYLESKPVLTNLLERCMSDSVGTVLEKDGVSVSFGKWVIKESINRFDDIEFRIYILSSCSKRYLELESVTASLLKRNMVDSVEFILLRDVSKSFRRWVVEESSKTLDDWDFAFYILPHCLNEDLKPVTLSLIKREMYTSVGEVLKKDVDETFRRWVVEEASKTVEDWDFKTDILPHCLKGDLEHAMQHITRRGMWESVITFFQKDFDEKHWQWVVEDAIRRLDETQIATVFIPHCSSQQLTSLLTALVNRGMWKSVSSVLKKGVSKSQHTWAVQTASKTANDDDFENHILCHCHCLVQKGQLDIVLERARRRRLLTNTFLSWNDSQLRTPWQFYVYARYNIAASRHNPLLVAVSDSRSNTRKQCSILQLVACNLRYSEICVGLGLSTHQPELTDHIGDIAKMKLSNVQAYEPTSPFLTAVSNGHFDVASMLYESGSCSYAELLALYTFFCEVIDQGAYPPSTSSPTASSRPIQERTRISMIRRVHKTFVPHLTKMATTPRSLMSTCRLVISRSLNIRGERYRDIQQLPLNDMVKKYVRFSDITSISSPEEDDDEY